MARVRRRDALAAAAIALLCGGFAASGALDAWHGLSIDALTALDARLLGPRHAGTPPPTVVVAIDEETYRTPPFAGTPTIAWTREIGRVLGAVVEGGAAVVGFDVVFPSSIEQSEIPFDGAPLGARLRGFDRDFLRALAAAAGAGKVVLGEVQHRDEPIRPAAGQRFAVGAGRNVRALNAFSDADEVVRRLPLVFTAGDGRVEPSMALELAARALGTEPAIGRDGSVTLGGWRVPSAVPGTLTLAFDGAADAVPTHSLADLRACTEKGDRAFFHRAFAGKVVLVGTLLDIEDRKTTSLRFATAPERAAAPRCALPPLAMTAPAAGRTIAGVYVHATAVDNLLRRDALAEAGRGATAAAAVVLAGLASAAALRLAPLPAAAVGAGLAFAWTALALAAFRQALVLPLVEPFVAAFGALGVTAGYRFAVADRARRLLRRSFALYLAPQVIDRLVDADRPPALGGETREVTIFFSDIAGFSAFSETMAPEALVTLMNAYLSAMTEVIEDAGGYVDKYVGDSIVAVFGAPMDDAAHARHAVQAALGCRARLARMNDDGDPALGGRRVAHRIGIHTGPALVGNVGSRRRFNYTVMGDAVNLASRLEGANRHLGTDVLVSETTRAAAGDACAWREIDAIRVKGRARPVTVFEPVGAPADSTPAQAAQLAAYARGLAAWRARDFAGAAARFAEAGPGDEPSVRFLERARRLAARPPGPDWEPVHTLDAK